MLKKEADLFAFKQSKTSPVSLSWALVAAEQASLPLIGAFPQHLTETIPKPSLNQDISLTLSSFHASLFSSGMDDHMPMDEPDLRNEVHQLLICSVIDNR